MKSLSGFIFIFSATVYAAALPSVGTFIYNTDYELKIKKVDSKINFTISGVNSYRGDTCSIEGEAILSKTAAWSFSHPENTDCNVSLRVLNEKFIDVQVDKCNGFCGMSASLESGKYTLSNCVDFEGRSKKIGELSRAKKFPEALKLTQALEKDCGESVDENSRGELHSDLAFLYLKTGDKKNCVAHVKQGIASMHLASQGLKALKEAYASYLMEDENGKKSCLSSPPGCDIYKERIKIYGHLEHNRKLCGK